MYLPFTIGYIIYDDGCHLRKFARNPCRKDTTSTSQQLACLEIVVDKMHIAGHKDPWCLQNCDSRKILELRKVNYWVYGYSNSYNSYHLSIQVDMEVCEQTLSWLSRYSRMIKVWMGIILCFLCYMFLTSTTRETTTSCIILDCYRYYHCGIYKLRFVLLLPVIYIYIHAY